ncbi:histidine phosphatase family protein [Nocardia harenae]|uniref:histidine phosphatase family protein n=1 Tax=Nocardia harenae TaxID=358707 RepID=UPI00082975FD|nr:histidine phosphatase family protein [Nocardia harenae]
MLRYLEAVRHGETPINVAGANPAVARPYLPDSQVFLTERGARQAVDVGRRFAALPQDELPDLVLCSPYPRARRTWEIAAAELASPPPFRIDDRLHDRDRGRFRVMSQARARLLHPDEAAAEDRDPLGYRPPEGESFRDVADRVGAVVAELLDPGPERVLIVAHDAVVLMLRQVLEHLPDPEMLALAERGLAGNGSITSWHRDPDFRLLAYDVRTHLTS